MFPHKFGIQFRSNFDKAPLLKYHPFFEQSTKNDQMKSKAHTNEITIDFMEQQKSALPEICKHLQKCIGKNSNQSHIKACTNASTNRIVCVEYKFVWIKIDIANWLRMITSQSQFMCARAWTFFIFLSSSSFVCLFLFVKGNSDKMKNEEREKEKSV